MNVGIVGLGKLGLPVAYAIAARGLTVFGHDPLVTGPPEDTTHEEGLADAITAGRDRVWFTPLSTVVKECDVIFVAVQTPHQPRFEGVTPLPADRADFDYSFLVQVCKHISEQADKQHKPVTVAVISTVLPGTLQRCVIPVLGDRVRLAYNPSFIAMGTTVRDFLDPEFVLLGGASHAVDRVYKCILDGPRRVYTSIENAELIKVAYNTFIGLKIAYANTLMEICHKTGCDIDQVTERTQARGPPPHQPGLLGWGDGRRWWLPPTRQHRALLARAGARPQLRPVRGRDGMPGGAG